jgi:hypothetical protein
MQRDSVDGQNNLIAIGGRDKDKICHKEGT